MITKTMPFAKNTCKQKILAANEVMQHATTHVCFPFVGQGRDVQFVLFPMGSSTCSQ
jgi:hypothetical protein